MRCLTPVLAGADNIIPVDTLLEKRAPPSGGTIAAAVVEAARLAPRPKVKPVGAGCCGAVDVRTEPKVKLAPVGAAEEAADVVVREKGVAEPVGLLKARLKPVDAAVDAGAPERHFEAFSKIPSLYKCY